MLLNVGINLVESDKVKIKLSELTDIYDIEDDSNQKITETVTKSKKTYDEVIDDADKHLEESFDDGSW